MNADKRNNSPSKKAPKCVRFSTKNETFEVEKFIPEDLCISVEEFLETRKRARQDAKRARKTGFGAILDGVFDDTNGNAQIVLNSFVDQCTDSGYDSLRGLERHISKKHGDTRMQMKKAAIQSVVDQYDFMQKRNVNSDKMWEDLNLVYCHFSRKAKMYARQLGRADEAVVLKSEREDAAATAAEARKLRTPQVNQKTQAMIMQKFLASRKNAARPFTVASRSHALGEAYAGIA